MISFKGLRIIENLMSKIQKAKITPKVLKWARDVCNLSLEVAAKKVSVAEDTLICWENGQDLPTVNQARNLAKVYKVPLISLWLNEPPPDYKPPKFRDFRRLPGSLTGHFSYNLAISIRESSIKRDLAIELARNLNRTIETFSSHFPTNTTTKKLASEIRNLLNLSWGEQSEWKDPRIAFNSIKEKIESLDILVFQFPRIEVEEFRGFSIYNKVMPVIGLNRKDSYAARSFSLLHEFTHLIFGETSVSNVSETDSGFSQDERIEKICNEVAGATLVPQEELQRIIRSLGSLTFENIAGVAKSFGVSREVVAMRSFQIGILNQDGLGSLLNKIGSAYKPPPKPGFVPPHMDFVSKAGKPLARSLLENLSRGHITENDFSDYAGLKLKHITKVKEAILFSSE